MATTDADRIERAIKRLRVHEEGVKAARAELAVLLGFAGRPSAKSQTADGNGAASAPADPGEPGSKGLGERGTVILRSIKTRGDTTRLRDIILDVTGQEHPGDVEAKRIRSAMHHLKQNGYVASAERGVWSITEAGASALLKEEAGF